MFVVSGEFETENVKDIIQAIQKEEENSDFENIEIVLCTHGGSTDAVFAIGNFVKTQIKKKLKIVCSGTVQSAGITLLAFADIRWAYEDCIFMIHGGSSPLMADDYKQVDIKKRYMELYDSRERKVFEKTFGKETTEKIMKYYESYFYCTYLTAEEAKELGIIDEILYYPE